MKKILAILALSALAMSSFAQSIFTTNTLAAGTHLLSTAGAQIYRIQVTATNVPVTVEFFDQDSTADPYYGTNYTTSAYTSYTTYSTNYVTSATSITGYTNYFTNSGVWTVSGTTAAATNALPRSLVIAVPGSGSVTLDTDASFFRGVIVRTTGGALHNITYNYNTRN